MGSNQLYSLSWGEFGTSLVSAVQLLRCHGDLVDVTLAAGGRSFPAHKIVLSAASPFLLDLLKSTPCHHPVLLLAGVNAHDLEALLEFVYRGEVSVDPSQLPSLLQAAHCLNIQGLAPGALHPDQKMEDPTTGTSHQVLSRDAMNTFIPMKRRKRGKRKNSEGSSGPPGKKWRQSHARSEVNSEISGQDIDVLANPDGSIRSEDDIASQHNGEETSGKVRGASDQPATCPLCGATLRQARNLRRHLEMLHFGAGKIPPPLNSETEPTPSEGSPNSAVHHRAPSRASNQSAPTSTSPVPGATTPDQSVATVVVVPSALCQPVMLASPEDPHHGSQHNQSQQSQQEQNRNSGSNLTCVLGPPLLPPPSSMMAAGLGHGTAPPHHHSHPHLIRYPTHPTEHVSRADQQILRGVGIYTDTRLPRPDPGMGGTEM